MKRPLPLFTFVMLLGCMLHVTPISKACERAHPFSLDELFESDVIVRATAVKYVTVPEPHTMTTDIPDSTIEFRIEEVLKGKGVPTIIINGYLSDKDDFNDVPTPYKFVRPNGRRGSCFANTYKQGAQFLLFLKQKGSGYTPYWNALAPTNEQLRYEDDPWMEWTRIRLHPCAKANRQDIDLQPLSREEVFNLITLIRGSKSVPSAYKLGKCYVQKSPDADDEYVKYIKKWVDKYEKAQR